MTPHRPDDTERQVRKWVLKRNGDPLLIQDVVELVLAVDDDASARHHEVTNAVSDMRDRCVDRCRTCDDRFKVLEALEHQTTNGIRAIAREEMQAHEPRRKDDANDSDYTPERKPCGTVEVVDAEKTREVVWKVRLLWGGVGIVATTTLVFLVQLGLSYWLGT